MRLYKHQDNNIVLVQALETRVDSNLAPDFKKELLASIVQDSPNIIIDLQNVEYMDSSGLGALLFGHRQAIHNKGIFVIINLKKQVKKLIEIAQLTRVLNICESEKQAIQIIKRS